MKLSPWKFSDGTLARDILPALLSLLSEEELIRLQVRAARGGHILCFGALAEERENRRNRPSL